MRTFSDHRKTYSARDVAVIQQASRQFSKVKNHGEINIIEESKNTSKYFIWGVEKTQQASLVDELRQKLFQRMSGARKIVQFVGDCELFSVGGTEFAKSHIEQFVSDPKNILTFGHSGLFKDGARDVNGILIDLVERCSAQERLVSNVVDQCTQAIEDWGFRTCISTINNMIMVYNQNGNPTKFGDDCDISDKIMLKGDVLVLMEGGAQSLLQSLNALNQGATIIALAGLRDNGSPKFSAARFFQRLKQEPNELIETHFQNEIRQQQVWEPNKLALLDEAKKLLQNADLQEKIRSLQVEINFHLQEIMQGHHESNQRASEFNFYSDSHGGRRGYGISGGMVAISYQVYMNGAGKTLTSWLGADLRPISIRAIDMELLELMGNQNLNLEDKIGKVKYLLARGADINVFHQGTTPLYKAIETDSLDLVKALIELGADINQKTIDNHTPLIRAFYLCKSSAPKIVEMLFAFDADVLPIWQWPSLTARLPNFTTHSKKENSHLEMLMILLRYTPVKPENFDSFFRFLVFNYSLAPKSEKYFDVITAFIKKGANLFYIDGCFNSPAHSLLHFIHEQAKYSKVFHLLRQLPSGKFAAMVQLRDLCEKLMSHEGYYFGSKNLSEFKRRLDEGILLVEIRFLCGELLQKLGTYPNFSMGTTYISTTDFLIARINTLIKKDDDLYYILKTPKQLNLWGNTLSKIHKIQIQYFHPKLLTYPRWDEAKKANLQPKANANEFSLFNKVLKEAIIDDRHNSAENQKQYDQMFGLSFYNRK